MKTKMGSIFICTMIVVSIFAGITLNLGKLSMNARGESTLEGVVTSYFSILNSGAQSAITVQITNGTNPVQGVRINLSSNGGGLFCPQNGTTDINGNFISIFNAPTVTTQTNCTITAQANKTGHYNESGQVNITINPIPWPMFQQNIRHNGQSPYNTSSNPGLLKWSFMTGSHVKSSPVIGSDGTIYVGSSDNKLYAINPDGTQKWNFTTGHYVWLSAAIDSDGTIYVGSYDHKMYAINPNGTQKWNFTTGNSVYSSPAIGSDGTIYCSSADHKLYAINPNGTQRWSFTTGAIIYNSSPTIGVDGTIYFGSIDKKLYAIYPNGTQKWNFTSGDLIYSSPTIDSDGTIYVGSYDHKMYAIYPNGTQKWNFTVGDQIYSSPAIDFHGTIYIGSLDKKIYAIYPNGTQKWNFTTGNKVWSSPVIGNDGTIYIGSDDYKLYAVNPDGTQKWNFTSNDWIRHSPAVDSDGTIYVGSWDYKLYAIGEPDIPKLVEAGPDRTINEGEVVQFNGAAYKKVSYPAWPVDISGNGQYLAIGWDKNVTLFSTASNVPIWTYNTGGLGRVGDLKLSEDGQFLVVGSYINVFYFNTSSDIPLWNVSIGDPGTIRYDSDPGNRLDMTRDGKYIAAAAGGDRVHIYDTTNATPTIPYWDIFFGSEVNVVRFSGDGRYLTIAAKNGDIKLCWVSGKSINWTYDAGDMVYSTSISFTGNNISSGQGSSSKVRFFESWSSSPTWTRTIDGRQFEQIMSDDGKYLVSGNHHDGGGGSWNGFAFWDTSDSSPIWEYHTSSVNGLNTDAVDMDCDANYVVGGSRDNNVYLFSKLADNVSGWGPSDGVPVFTFDTGGKLHYNSVSLSYDGTYFAAGSFGSGLYLFTTVGTPALVWSWFANNLVYVQDPNMYTWDFNDFEDSDGDGNYLNDTDATGKTPSHIYGDDGEYSVNLMITENNETLGNDTCVIKVNNVAPTIDPFGPLVAEVGFPIDIDVTASDPGSDDLTFSWEWGDGTTETIMHYYNDGMMPDPFPSPSGIFPFSVPSTVQHTYENEGIYTINLTVEDDDGGVAEYNTSVTVIGLCPPTLYINISADKKNVTLYWDSPYSLGIDHYLIYRSSSQTGFDFDTVWVNTSEDKEQHELIPVPLRTMWNDTKAAFPGNDTNYEEQYYYIVRTVSIFETVSSTSRTVGKWTKSFPGGVSTFSLPLEPLETMNKTADFYLKDMNAEYIKWMDSTNHTWMKNGEGGVNDTQLEVGKGYEVKFVNQTNYTFTGMPGAMIIYNDIPYGFDADPVTGDARNLSVTVDGSSVTLLWQTPERTNDNISFRIYRSHKRDGFWGIEGIDYEFYGMINQCDPGSWQLRCDFGVIFPGTEHYYMIVPFDNETGQECVSTYSIGIWVEEYLSEYDTLGIPLKVEENHTADWYCDNIPDTVGINYYNVSTQRWFWHSTRMNEGAYDPQLIMVEGYQISTTNMTQFTFIGI